VNNNEEAGFYVRADKIRILLKKNVFKFKSNLLNEEFGNMLKLKYLYFIMNKNRNDLTSRIKTIVQDFDPDAKIYLYGSRVQNRSHKFSDWDLLILINKETFSYQLKNQLSDSLFELEIETGELISPLIFNENEWYSKHRVTPFFKNVMNEGVLI